MAPKSKNIKYNPIEWAMWANVLGVWSGLLIFAGGIISLFGFTRPYIGYYAIAAGAIVFLVEWPRGRRRRGHTLSRPYQRPLSNMVKSLGCMLSNYFVRALIYLCMCVPCFFELPPLVGGAILAFTGIVYFLGAYRGEQWAPLPEEEDEESGSRKPKISQAPTHAPPRLPPSNPAPRLASEGRAADYAMHENPIAEKQVTHNPAFSASASANPAGGPKPAARPAARPVAATTPAPTTAAPILPAAAAAPRPAARPKPAVAPKPLLQNWTWTSATDPSSGDVYYINTATNETTWDKPEGWDDFVRAHDASNA